MNFNPKAPPIYKPAPQPVAAPPVYRPQQQFNPRVQLKPAANLAVEMRPAPPVYRPAAMGALSISIAPSVQKIQSTAQARPSQARYELDRPVWIGSRRQQIRVKEAGSPAPVGSVDIRYTQAGIAYISNLEVAQSHRRQGAATMLMKAAMESARRNGSSATELEVRPGPGISNQALAGMYQELGFRNGGISPRGNPTMSASTVLQRKPAASPFLARPNLPARPGLHSVVQAMEEDDDPISRFHRAHERNQSGKATPQAPRSIFELQESSSYGYDDPVIDDGMLQGSFRRGWGGQPFLSVRAEDFGGATGKSDYDSIIAVFKRDRHMQSEIAEAILVRIDHGNEPFGYSFEAMRAMSLLIQLTQVVESHDSRMTGVDKWARACLSRILNGESSFHAEFNRKDGNYLPARARSGGSKFGGQESSRALLGKPKKSDRAKKKDVVSSGVLESLAAMSDSSDDEESEDMEF